MRQDTQAVEWIREDAQSALTALSSSDVEEAQELLYAIIQHTHFLLEDAPECIST